MMSILVFYERLPVFPPYISCPKKNREIVVAEAGKGANGDFLQTNGEDVGGREGLCDRK